MTEEELTVIEARANAATPGAWIWEDWVQDDGPNEYTLTAPPETRHGWRPDSTFPDLRNLIISDEDRSTSREDRDFIASARDDVPALVAEVRRLLRYMIRIHYSLAEHGETDLEVW